MFILIFFNTVEALLSIWIKEFLDGTQLLKLFHILRKNNTLIYNKIGTRNPRDL